MKNSKLFRFYVMGIVFACITLTWGCAPKTAQSITKGSVEVKLPFDEPQYRTDKDYFRAKNSGKSPDLATSKKIALLNAKTEIAQNINSVIKAVTEQYINQRSIADKQEYESKFEELTKNVVSQQLNEIRILGEKTFKETDGSFTYWVAIEMPKQTIVDNVSKKISSNQKLQLDYDKKKFEETFNAEMDKLAQERN